MQPYILSPFLCEICAVRLDIVVDSMSMREAYEVRSTDVLERRIVVKR